MLKIFFEKMLQKNLTFSIMIFEENQLQLPVEIYKIKWFLGCLF